MSGLLIALIVLIAVLGYTVNLLARRIAQVEQSVKDVHPLNRAAFYEAHGPNRQRPDGPGPRVQGGGAIEEVS